jgi:Na+-driven multidrug efflux pump
MLFLGTAENPDAIIHYAHMYLVSQMVFFPCMVMLSIWRGGLKGLGSTVPAVLCGVIELIARVVVSFFFAKKLDLLFMAGPLAWVFTSIFLAILYPRVLRASERRIAAERIDYYDQREEQQASKEEESFEV